MDGRIELCTTCTLQSRAEHALHPQGTHGPHYFHTVFAMCDGRPRAEVLCYILHGKTNT